MQSSPAIAREQEPYSFRDQDLLEQPLVSIAQPDHEYIALQLAQFLSQVIDHPFELLVIGFDRFGQKTNRGELFLMLVDKHGAVGILDPKFVGHGYFCISFRARSF